MERIDYRFAQGVTIPRTGREHAITGEHDRAVTAFDLLEAHVRSLRELFEQGLPTPSTRQAVVTAAHRLTESLTRLETLAALPEPTDSDLEPIAGETCDDRRRRRSAMILRVPIDTVDMDCEEALEQACRGDYDVTWHQAACALGRLARFRTALESIAHAPRRTTPPRQVAADALALEESARENPAR